MRELLSPQYFRLFCQKFAGEFLPGFYETVCSAKRINEMGTHQLLLDLHNLKVPRRPLSAAHPGLILRRARVALSQALMLQLPIVGLDASDPEVQKEVPRLYMKFVTKHMARVEMVRLRTQPSSLQKRAPALDDHRRRSQVLKLIGTPIEMLVERFKIMWPDGEGSDLQKIMTLKVGCKYAARRAMRGSS